MVKLTKQFPPPIPPELHSPSTTTQPTIEEIKPREKASKTVAAARERQAKVKVRLEIPPVIKENWMGVVGAVACCVGAVFFGITSDLLAKPEMRVIIMLLFSLILLVVAEKLKHWQLGPTVCSWFSATAGAIILFATLGAGSIDGLQCLPSKEIALAVLLGGIVANIYLAAKTSSQAVSSLHGVLSTLTLSFAPQTLILLPVGAVIVCLGIIIANRSKWQIPVLLLIISYAALHVVWMNRLPITQEWAHYLAIGCSLVVALAAAASHYSERYRSENGSLFILLTHCTNWLLLAWNVYLHAKLGLQPFILLGLISVAVFSLSYRAKQRGVIWLYRADAIMAQMIALASFASLYGSAINAFDITLLAFVEIILFNLVCNLQKEVFLCRVGYLLQTASYGLLIYLTLTSYSTGAAPLSFRLLLVTAISWSFYIYGKARSFESDALLPIFPYSIMVIAGAFCLCLSYACNHASPLVQGATLLILALLGYWRHRNEDRSWNVAFIGALFFVHVLLWGNLLLQAEAEVTLFKPYQIDFAGLLVLDLVLVFGNMLKLKTQNTNIHHFVIYFLAFHTLLGTNLFGKESNILIPAVLFLGYSILALELAKYARENLHYEQDVKAKIEMGLLHVGYVFVLGFFWRFITIHLQDGGLWHGLSLRWIVEALALVCIGYWLAYAPTITEGFTKYCRRVLVEAFLAFVTLIVLAECSDFYRPLVWITLALILLLTTDYFSWPKRLFIYSWMYFLSSVGNVTFLTCFLTQPALSIFEKYNLPAFAAITLQLFYAYLVPKVRRKEFANESQKVAKYSRFMFRDSTISILLPIFLGLALMLAYNYEKAILTLLWVGLSCIYLVCGLVARSKASIQIAMCTLLVCIARLLFYDLVQKDISIRAIVFFGAGLLMLLVSVFYRKYKYRIELHEQV